MKPNFHGAARGGTKVLATGVMVDWLARTVQRADTCSREQNALTRSPLQRMLKLPGVKPA